jgi:uncharacterized protein involved in exopolysaccharide biosynthesis/Mrp family chromosome partitioning ATPase
VTNELTLRDFLRVLNRRRTMIAVIVVIATGIAALLGSLQTPIYTAEATLLLDTRKTQVINIQAVMSGLPDELAAIRSELDVLSSGQMARQVVEQAKLTSDPEFAMAVRKPGDPPVPVGLLDRVREWVGLKMPVPPATDEEATDSAIEAFQRHLRILNDGRSYTIHVQVDSVSAEKAAYLANLVVKLYLDDQIQAKHDANERANSWLNERIVELRDELRKSETSVQEFRARNQLIETRGATVTDQQLAELNTQLILARTERAQAEARLKRIRDLENSSAGLDAAREVLSSSLIQRLREQESDLLRRQAELSAVYDEKHPKMINMRAEMADFRRTIKEEIEKVAQSVSNDVAVARSRETALAASLADIEARTNEANKADVQLQELKRDADANRSLFQTFLNRSKETGSQDNLLRPDARVISEAIPPKKSASLAVSQLMGLAFLGSLLASVALSLLLERLDNRILTPVQLHQLTGASVLGMVPDFAAPRSITPRDFATSEPYSAFSESLRSIRHAARFSSHDTPPKIILVTSSIVSEGKTTFCAAFGGLAAQSGSRVLMVDCDARRPQLEAQLGEKPIANLGDILLGTTAVETLPHLPSKGGLHFIGPMEAREHIYELVASEHMGRFLTEASAHYDLIILDSPPVMAVSVAPIIAHLVDICLYLVRWEQTTTDLVTNGLAQMDRANCKAIGLVLSRVDLRRHRRLGYGDQAYYYGQYRDYYTT